MAHGIQHGGSSFYVLGAGASVPLVPRTGEIGASIIELYRQVGNYGGTGWPADDVKDRLSATRGPDEDPFTAHPVYSA